MNHHVLRVRLTRSWPAQANLALTCKDFRPITLAGQHATLRCEDKRLRKLLRAFNACLANNPKNCCNFNVLEILSRDYVGPMAPALPPLLNGWASLTRRSLLLPSRRLSAYDGATAGTCRVYGTCGWDM